MPQKYLRQNCMKNLSLDLILTKFSILLRQRKAVTVLLPTKERIMKKHVRDTAILMLFLGTGIRISELVGLNNEDLNFKDNSFIVTRKGGNKSILYFDEDVAAALQRYLDYKENNYEDLKEPTALFVSNNKSRITVRAVENLVQKYAKIISPLKKISPHKLRSTYGTKLYRATGDIYVVADVLGHKDVNTTRKHYAAISDDNRRAVVGKVKLKPEE